MAKFENILKEHISEDEKILAEVHFRESKFTFQFPVRNVPTTSPFFAFFRVTDAALYATDKKLIRIAFETTPEIRILSYSKITSVELIRRRRLPFKHSFFQIEGELSDEERKLWRIPANARNAEEFCRVVNEIIRR
mgnify:CR=1 FL=1